LDSSYVGGHVIGMNFEYAGGYSQSVAFWNIVSIHLTM